MNENKTNSMLLGLGIVGFLAIIAGPLLFLYTERYLTLLVSLFGMLLSMYSSIQSQKTPVRKRVDTVVVEDLLFAPKIENEEIKKEPKVSKIPEKNNLFSDLKTEASFGKLSVHLRIDNTSAEALLRLVDKMETSDLVLYNEAFDLDNDTDKKVFKDKFLPVPVIGLAKNRMDNFNILAGLNHNDVETIGTIDLKDLEKVKAVYPSTQSIQALIYGGRYRSEENTLHNQTYRVFLTFYS